VQENAAAPKATSVADNTPATAPQLVKTASMELVVVSVEESIKQISSTVRQQKGDILSLEDSQANPNDRHRATLQLRIPQEKLEVTLDTLAKLGTIQNRNLSSEDVSNQLVDSAARLKNLRKTEAALLEIMNRSGSVADILKVAQEVSNVRQSIEQIDAQLQNLQNQVAYSKVTISLQALATSGSNTPALGLQLQETWQQSTSSLGRVTTGFLKLGLWLLVYSPYLALIIFVIYGYRRWLRKPKVVTITATSESSQQDLRS
jgi:vacuolar-type H+-ATPase subunit I/STV1